MLWCIDDNPMPLNADGSMMLDETCDFNDTWKEMEKVLASGKVKSIGVSNFSIKTSGANFCHLDLNE